MSSLFEDSPSPFDSEKLGKPTSYGNTHILRRYEHILYEITDFGLPTEKGIRKVFGDGCVREFPLTEAEKNHLMREVEKQSVIQQSREKKLLEIAKPLSGHRFSIDFHPEETCAVYQHEYAITTSNSIKPVLASLGAGPCLIVAIYDEESKKAVLTHIDSKTKLDSLNRLLKMMSPSSSSVHLCGGDMSSKEMCMDIVDLIESNGFRISSADIVRSDVSSLAIDSRTGSIYSPISSEDLEIRKDTELRLKMAFFHILAESSPLNLIYDGSLPSEARPSSTPTATARPPSPALVVYTGGGGSARAADADKAASATTDSLPSSFGSL
jgi:hypothetical protein